MRQFDINNRICFIFWEKIMKHIILIPGMLGAGCTKVAEILGKKLNLECINTEKIVKRIVTEGRLSYTELEAMTLSGEINLEEVIQSIVLDYLSEGNVIVEGRSAFLVLDRDVDLKIFLFADTEFRVNRIAERRGIALDEAREAVRESDEDRSGLVKRLYRKSWLDPTLYDMLINTANLKFEAVAEIIRTALENKYEKE